MPPATPCGGGDGSSRQRSTAPRTHPLTHRGPAYPGWRRSSCRYITVTFPLPWQAALELQLTAERLSSAAVVRQHAEFVSRHFESVREELGDVVREVEAERAKVAEAARAQVAEPPKRPAASSLAAGYAPTGNEYRDRKRAAGTRGSAVRRAQTPTAARHTPSARYNR